MTKMRTFCLSLTKTHELSRLILAWMTGFMEGGVFGAFCLSSLLYGVCGIRGHESKCYAKDIHTETSYVGIDQITPEMRSTIGAIFFFVQDNFMFNPSSSSFSHAFWSFVAHINHEHGEKKIYYRETAQV
jgi:hypothetical protein